MYDELIGRLRANGELFQKYIPNAEGEILLQAADAIEQLSNAGSAYGRGWTLGYDAGREESKPCWIPVTERLPGEYETVLLLTMSGEVISGYYDSDYKSYCDMTGFRHLCTHWMPLPEPPKEGE